MNHILYHQIFQNTYRLSLNLFVNDLSFLVSFKIIHNLAILNIFITLMPKFFYMLNLHALIIYAMQQYQILTFPLLKFVFSLI